MLIKYRYSLKELFLWTRLELLFFISYATLISYGFEVLNYTFLELPWTPVALIGTAVAFIVGFQNNAAYERIWEARKIWGGIVNVSRTWGMKSADMISNENPDSPLSFEEKKVLKRELVMRHIAWLTALRYNLRESKPWETMYRKRHRSNVRIWADKIYVPEKNKPLSEKLKMYLSEEELAYVLSKKNKAAAVLYLQSNRIKQLKDEGYIWRFAFLKLEDLLEEMFTLQGQSERIKNFPYPRQYATISYVFVWIFIVLLPFGIVPEFAKMESLLQLDYPIVSTYFVWVAVPFCATVSWVFHTMKRIGIVGENPFEGSPNDVPISTISRSIEIDMRQLLDEDDKTIPKPFPETGRVQM